jgi:hypothetical protein
MKNMLRVLSIILAVGAILQTFYSYAEQVKEPSINDHEEAIIKLIEIKRNMDAQGITSDDTLNEPDFPLIKTEEQFKDAFAIHTLEYIKAINAQEALLKNVKKGNLKTHKIGGEPGI